MDTLLSRLFIFSVKKHWKFCFLCMIKFRNFEFILGIMVIKISFIEVKKDKITLGILFCLRRDNFRSKHPIRNFEFFFGIKYLFAPCINVFEKIHLKMTSSKFYLTPHSVFQRLLSLWDSLVF